MMRRTSRPIAALFLLGTAACASDGLVAPKTAPEHLRSHAPAPKYASRNTPVGEPLYVVDGVLQDGLPTQVDTMGIDRIQVLRGAEAVDRYGERAANGAVLITTRPPKPVTGT